MAEIRWSVGGTQNSQRLVGEGPFGIGRGADNSVVLDDPDVSRHHAQLLADDLVWGPDLERWTAQPVSA